MGVDWGVVSKTYKNTYHSSYFRDCIRICSNGTGLLHKGIRTMINLLFIHSSSELYGSDRSLLNIIKYIDKNCYKIHVILPCEGPLVEEIKKIDGVELEIFPVAVLRRKNLSVKGCISYIKECVASTRFIKEYIKTHDITIVDTNTSVVFPGAIAAKRCGVKNVWHIREIVKNRVENRAISYMMNRYADVIIANSKATGDALRLPAEKVKVVYNAIEVEGETDKIPHEDVIIGMAGRINRWKGQKLFVDAAELVLKKHPYAKFWIVGETYSGEEYLKEELYKYIKDKQIENHVLLLGQVINMADFYRSIDIFVLPSVQPEPFGLVVIEAMEYKLPVIATNHGGPVEIIEDGINGFLVDYEAPMEMADKIDLLIGDEELRNRIGTTAQYNKREKYYVEQMVSSIEEIFEELLKAN